MMAGVARALAAFALLTSAWIRAGARNDRGASP